MLVRVTNQRASRIQDAYEVDCEIEIDGSVSRGIVTWCNSLNEQGGASDHPIAILELSAELRGKGRRPAIKDAILNMP